MEPLESGMRDLRLVIRLQKCSNGGRDIRIRPANVC